MIRTLNLTVFAMLLAAAAARGDGLIVNYEGDVMPDAPGAPFLEGNPCEPDCSRRLENGYFIMEWGVMGDFAGFSNSVAAPPTPPPDTLWVEWRFRSNQPRPSSFAGCDGFVLVDYKAIIDNPFMYQDAVRDFEGGDFVNGLAPDFHTYRFESLDGINYTLSVDGFIFNVDSDTAEDGFHFVQFGGTGGCAGFRPQPVRNEWDFIRYGTIGDGELIVSVDPPPGNIITTQGEPLDIVTITFDQPAYLYIDDITVSVTGGVAPTVIATRRPDNAPPEVLEIVIDGRLPLDETTTFTFDTGSGPQTVQYTRLAPGIPTSSTWGLIAMGLATLIASGLIFRKRAIV